MLLAGPHVVTADDDRGMWLGAPWSVPSPAGERSGAIPKPLTSDARNPSPTLGRVPKAMDSSRSTRGNEAIGDCARASRAIVNKGRLGNRTYTGSTPVGHSNYTRGSNV